MIFTTALALFAVLAAGTKCFAQDPKNTLSPDERKSLEASLDLLDGGFTDWVLLANVSDKFQHFGSRAVPLLRERVKAMSERKDPRYALRLLGVLCRLDDDGARQIFEIVGSEDERAAAIAARVIGRSEAPPTRTHTRLAEMLEKEKRPAIISALALAAADAGATAAAKTIRARISEQTVEPEIARWLSIALANLEKDLPTKSVLEWLVPDSPLVESAILLARSHQDPEIESRLFTLLDSAEDETRWTWLIEALGACGGEESRKALRESLSAEEAEAESKRGGVTVLSSRVDARLLALLRLGEPAAVEWAKEFVASAGEGETSGIQVQLLGAAQSRIPELLGKWRITDADSVVDACLKSDAAPAVMRMHAARGLCWRRDTRGLRAAAELLAAPETTAMLFELRAAGLPAQNTLHQFVGNLDRPDYVPFEDGAVAVELGKQWIAWIAKNESKIQWREPLSESQDLLLWR